ncbi:hypothetical protein [Rhodococcus spongiicola]|uniref:SAM-dependent methyltransferase n=1 Tax=Rhodococcus spongiicola TaxID=2487352 RepID=A0A3S3AK88_9NOCA|nr:hypothetical protein [Rhodococcus spongiicola]RVW06674.1 hypothetical protein EF834_04595 [Rhodococcus spongiicola]
MNSDIEVQDRSLDEYRAMFGLTDNDLRRKILDCPAGAASFTAEVSDRGGDVIACDIAYFGHSAEALVVLAEQEAARGARYVGDRREQYRWTYFADPDEHERVRRQAVERFAGHLGQHPGRYVASRLPVLPFVDEGFDLTLSSHLLFSYSDGLDYGFHVEAIRELMRVTRELRIFPLVAAGSSTPYAGLDDMLSDLRKHGIRGRVHVVDYEFQRGADRMLVFRRE